MLADLVAGGQSFIAVGAIFLSMGVSAVVHSRLAAQNGRGADAWFVSGELLGGVAVAALRLLPPSTAHSQARSRPRSPLTSKGHNAARSDKGARRA